MILSDTCRSSSKRKLANPSKIHLIILLCLDGRSYILEVLSYFHHSVFVLNSFFSLPSVAVSCKDIRMRALKELHIDLLLKNDDTIYCVVFFF